MSSPQNTVIFSAPQGWGKTRQADALRREFGCSSIVEEWRPGRSIRSGALHLTNTPPEQLNGAEVLPARVVARGWRLFGPPRSVSH